MSSSDHRKRLQETVVIWHFINRIAPTKKITRDLSGFGYQNIKMTSFRKIQVKGDVFVSMEDLSVQHHTVTFQCGVHTHAI